MTHARRLRNQINVLVNNAKAILFPNALYTNKKNSKKFWRIIKSFTDDNVASYTAPEFKDPVTKYCIPSHDVPDHLNSYFVNISDRLGVDNSSIIFSDLRDLYDTMDRCAII